jgi:PAS domain S-box-containing protein
MPDMFIVFGADGTILDYKPSRFFDPALPPDEFMGRRLDQLIPPEISTPAMTAIEKVLAGGDPELLEYSLAEEGDVKEFEARFTSLGEKEALCVIREVTFQKEQARRLERSEDTFKALINASPNMAILLDHAGMIMAINDRAAGMYNHRAEEMIDTSYWDYINPQIAEMRAKRLRDIIRTQQPAQVMEVVGDRTFEVSGRPVVDHDGKVECVGFFIRDVTDRIKGEDVLIESEARHRCLFEDNPVPMYVYDMDSLKILSVNEAMVQNYGYSRAEFMTMTMEQIRPAEEVDRILENVRQLRGGKVYHGVWKHQKKDGTILDVDITSTDFPFQGHVARLVLCDDITAKLGVERALRESEARFRTAFMTSPDAFAIIRATDGMYEDVNDAFLETTGFTRDEIVGKTSEEFRIWSDQDDRDRFYAELEKNGRVSHFEADFVFKDDRKIRGLISANIIHLGGVPHSLLAARDITPLKEAESALKESEARFRTAFITSPDSITISRLADGVFVEINEGFTRISGFTPKDVIGRSSFDIDIWVNESDRERLADGLRSSGVVENMEAPLRMKDGRIIDGLMSARMLDIGGVPNILLITRDITEWSRAREQIKASLAEKEVLLKEVHHRVKNNLQVISGLLNLQAHHITDITGREIYKESQNRVITMALIHEELYQARDLAHVDFADYIHGLAENLFGSYSIDRDRIELELDSERVDMVVDTAIPCGLILNELISNALKHAFPDGRKGKLQVSFWQEGEKDFRLVVADDGVGLPDKVDIRRTRSLGMQLVSVLADQLGAGLKIESGPGTTFTLMFREYMEAGTEVY